MKQIILIQIIVLLKLTSMLGQSPIIGYDKVEWGASIGEVKKHYPDIIEAHLYSDISFEESEMLRLNFTGEKYIQILNSKNDVRDAKIICRIFYFYNNQLFMTSVFYEETIVELTKLLYDKMVSIYGEFNDNKTSIEPLINYEQTTFYIRKYSNDLFIKFGFKTTSNKKEVLDLFTAPKNIILKKVYVSYFNPIIIKKIEEDSLKNQMNKIQL